MKKQTTYLKIYFDLCPYQSISFVNKSCYKNNILQSISGRLVGN